MDIIEETLETGTDFYNKSKRFITRCKKPDSKEFSKIAFATAVGFLVMGFIGFFVKLIHIPINNIIIGHQ